MMLSEFVLVVNAGSIFILIILAVLLLAATKFKGENGYAAAIIVLTTVPVYLYNICRSEEWLTAAQWLLPLSFSVNTLLMPLLWLFVRHNFDHDFRFDWKQSLHFIPSAICFIGSCVFIWLTPQQEIFDLIKYENTGKDNLIGTINSIIVFTQMFVYFSIIFVYLSRVRKFITSHYSQADWEYKYWIPKYMFLFAVLFVVVFICYVIWPRTDAWLIQIINVLAMTYLVYGSLIGANAPQVSSIQMKSLVKGHAAEPQTPAVDSQEQQRLISFAAQVQTYLQESEAYLQADYSLQDLAKATGIAANNISKAINTVLHQNFFVLINKMRCEKAKCLLANYRKMNITMDEVASKSGFNSRFTLNNSFKKLEGLTPTEWIKKQ